MLFYLASFNLNIWSTHPTIDHKTKVILDRAFSDFRTVINRLEMLAGAELDLYKSFSYHLMTPGHVIISTSFGCDIMIHTPWGGFRFKRKSDEDFSCRPNQSCCNLDGTTKHLDPQLVHEALNLLFIKDGYEANWIHKFDEKRRQWIKVKQEDVKSLVGQRVRLAGSTFSYEIGILDSKPIIADDRPHGLIDKGYDYRSLGMTEPDLKADFEQRTNGSPLRQAWLMGVHRGALKRELTRSRYDSGIGVFSNVLMNRKRRC